MNYKNAKLLVGKAGGELLAVDPDGVVIWSVGLTGGRYQLSDYLMDLPPECTFDTSGSVTMIDPRSRLTAQNFGDLAVQSGANPDFVVTSASRQAREMELMIGRLDQTEKRLNRRASEYEALQAAAALRKRPARDDVDLLDDNDPEIVDVANLAPVDDPEEV